MEERSDLQTQRLEEQGILDNLREKLNKASANVVDMIHSHYEPAPQLRFSLAVAGALPTTA